jgi:lipopolysaccharide/colanic/teichoic acid biosynthesis glycosyltransferase
MTRLLYMVTIPLSARAFLRGQLKFLKQRGYDLHLASSPAPRQELLTVAEREGIQAHFIPLEREISLGQDLRAFGTTLKLVRQLRPAVTNVGTPKAGLIGGLAAALSGVPARVYTLRGLRLETVSGPKRDLLLWMERLACACAHRVVCVSPSLRERTLQLRLTSPEKAVVLSSGSSNGLDAGRFLPSPALQEQAVRLREQLSLPSETPTVGFVGRFVRDKGIAELVEAFTQLHAANPQTRLLLLGDYEEGDPVAAEVRQVIDAHPGVVRAGFVADTAPYYQLMDILAFPTYREGLGNVALEAAAAGKPVVASNATGAIDTVVNGVTGFTVQVGHSKELASALQLLLNDKELAHKLGQAGQERVLREFKPERIWEDLDRLYQELLTEAQFRRSHRLKRTTDLLVASAGMVILGLPLLAIGILVRLKLGSPVLFSQQRPGLRGQPFTMYKFRTMCDSMDSQGQPLPDSERLTPLGRFLRASSLDELPELFNVLRGDMSLVGPRPLLMEYLDRYTPQQARRHEVRPGITGWAQVNGRNAISWEEKFALDVWYVDNRSFALDLKILWMTVRKVFKREGINAAGEATMPKFMGRPNHEG